MPGNGGNFFQDGWGFIMTGKRGKGCGKVAKAVGILLNHSKILGKGANFCFFKMVGVND